MPPSVESFDLLRSLPDAWLAVRSLLAFRWEGKREGALFVCRGATLALGAAVVVAAAAAETAPWFDLPRRSWSCSISPSHAAHRGLASLPPSHRVA